MKSTFLLRTLTKVGPGDHLCCLYETDEEHRALLTAYLRQGLERGEKTIYILDESTAGIVQGYLQDDGMDVETCLENGELSIIGVEEAYMKEGVFDPDRMIGLLRKETELALADGYSALRVTGEMTWALRKLSGSERLIEYEAKLNEFFPASQCVAICQYDRRRFKPAILLDVLSTHPIAIVGNEVFDNFCYLPPKDFLGPDREKAELERLLNNLIDPKLSGKAVLESEERYRKLIEAIGEGFAIIDENMVLTHVNSRFCERIGFFEDETIGRCVTDFFDETNRNIVLEEFGKRKQGDQKRYEIVWTGKDGGRIPTFILPEPIYDGAGRFKGSFVVITDISELKQREKELEISRSNLEEVNTALRVLLKIREQDRKELEENVLFNMKELVMPFLEKIKKIGLEERQNAYLSILESNLTDIISPFSRRLSLSYLKLTPTELEVANLVKYGETTKEVANVLNLSSRTVEFHRDNIRKKLGIKNKKINLRSRLLSTQ